ncbi:MAG: HD domain-containing protein [Gallionellaceae bacterium]|nr:MAG: HD domain-containing protein [Gallionellaceae bacterium]
MGSETQQTHDEHYLRAVTGLGNTRKIVATCDIYSQSGIKLVAAGFHITSELYERLVMHKLLPPIDKALSVENMLNPERILADVLALLDHNDKLRMVGQVVNQGNSYHQIVTDIRLPSPLAFKLTVAKEQFPQIYQHSLLLMVISVYLARCDGKSLHEEEAVAIAALFHDIGLLHIDPRLLEPSHMMTPAERRHLYTHPLTAYLLLSEFPELPKLIANAVLEHHEMMDGSGYPRGLHGEKISRCGQILAVAELAAKAFDSDNPSVPWKKLEVMLKLNSRKYGPGLIGHLNILHTDVAQTSANENEPDRLVEQVKLIARLFDDFNHLADPQCNDPICDFAQTRLAELRLNLIGAGFDPRDPAGLIQMFMDDPGCMAGYEPILGEAIWQFKSLVLEISRQWAEEVEKSAAETDKTEHAWLNEMRLVLSAAELDE